MQCRTSLLASLCWHINCLASNLQIIAQSCISRWKILHTSSKGWKVREQRVQREGGMGVMRRLAMAAAAADLGANLMESGASFNAKRGTMTRDVQGQWTMRQTCARQTPLALFSCSPSLYLSHLPHAHTRCCLLNCMTGSNWFQCGWERGRRGERKGCRRDTGYGLRCGSNSGSGAISVAFTLPLLRPVQFPMPATPSNF